MIKKRLLFGSLVLILMVITLLTACIGTNTTSTKSTNNSGTNTSASSATTTAQPVNWWDKFGEPQYGGTLTVQCNELSGATFDPTDMMGAEYQIGIEWLYIPDSTVDPSIHNYVGEIIEPQYYRGLLAESWEQTDPLTITVHIRKGVYWQKKAPVNGREFTAVDVQYNFDRLLGTGSGFTEPNPFYAGTLANLSSVVAVDNYTVQFKYKSQTALQFYQAATSFGMIASEWVQQGDLTNIQNAVGTGPWIPTEYVKNVSLTYSKNSNYWGYDERHPENKLPYLDNVKALVIADTSTALAALRTGKIDMYTRPSGGPTLVQAQNLAKTDPEINIAYLPTRIESIDLRCDTKPFDDIKVRQALQMAIDRKTIAKSHYLGIVDGTPSGTIYPVNKNWVTPYDKWPAPLQQTYSYNPEQAKTLLAAAGYPQGFKTSVLVASSWDIELLQIIKSQFMDIGVDMEIKPSDIAIVMGTLFSGKSDQMDFMSPSGLGTPIDLINSRSKTNNTNFTHNNDPAYEAMIAKTLNSTDLSEAQQLTKELDQYALEQSWSVNICPSVGPIFWQPWVKGYNGSVVTGGDPFYARWWINQDLKTTMSK